MHCALLMHCTQYRHYIELVLSDLQGSVEPATPEKRVATTTSAKISQVPVANVSKDYPTPSLVLPPATPTAQPTASKAAAEDQDVVTSQVYSS